MPKLLTLELDGALPSVCDHTSYRQECRTNTTQMSSTTYKRVMLSIFSNAKNINYLHKSYMCTYILECTMKQANIINSHNVETLPVPAFCQKPQYKIPI